MENLNQTERAQYTTNKYYCRTFCTMKQERAQYTAKNAGKEHEKGSSKPETMVRISLEDSHAAW